MGMENAVQGAIVAALEVYGDRNDVQSNIFEPYSNQQHGGLNGYSADVQCLLDGRRFLLLEIKEILWANNLPSFAAYDEYQHLIYHMQEGLKIPIRYGYAAVENLSYFRKNRRKPWPAEVLRSTFISKPKDLFGNGRALNNKQPNFEIHENLLDWHLEAVDPVEGENNVNVAAAAITASELKNSMLLILIQDDKGVLKTLSAFDLGKNLLELGKLIKDNASDKSSSTKNVVSLPAELTELVEKATKIYNKLCKYCNGLIEQARKDENNSERTKADQSKYLRNISKSILFSSLNYGPLDPKTHTAQKATV